LPRFPAVVACAAIVTSLPVIEAHAQNAPGALYGKSVVAQWTENRLQRWASDGKNAPFEPHSVASRLEVYISTEGRIFERRLANKGQVARVGGGTAARAAGSTTRFSGNTMQSVGAGGGGGRSISVQFEAAFSSCTVQVIFARGESGIVRGRSSSTQEPVEFKPTGVTGESCSIRDGNIFN
jgi:hypothetical protein